LADFDGLTGAAKIVVQLVDDGLNDEFGDAPTNCGVGTVVSAVNSFVHLAQEFLADADCNAFTAFAHDELQ
jgi:hypothetical protein